MTCFSSILLVGMAVAVAPARLFGDPSESLRAEAPAAIATEPAPVDSPSGSVRPTLSAELQPYAAIGSELARNSRLREAGLSEAQRDAFLAGVRATLNGDPYPFDEAAAQLFVDLDRRINAIEAELRARRYAEPGAMEAYMKATCAKFKMQRSESGLGFAVMQGNGNLRPAPEDTVVFSMTANGDDEKTAIPELTKERVRARVSDLMPGLAEGLQLMTLDSRAMFLIPPDLSFDRASWPVSVARGTPIFVIVTLHEIISPPVDP